MTTANGDVTQHEDVQAVYKASGNSTSCLPQVARKMRIGARIIPTKA